MEGICEDSSTPLANPWVSIISKLPSWRSPSAVLNLVVPAKTDQEGAQHLHRGPELPVCAPHPGAFGLGFDPIVDLEMQFALFRLDIVWKQGKQR